jgi:hypothetical protein
MAQINTGKAIVGGLAAGLVLNVVDYCVSGVWLASRFAAQTAKLNPSLDMMTANSIAGYVAVDFILGLMIVWLYAAMRPRFGPGAATARLSALFVWGTAVLFSAGFVISGMYTWKLMGASLAGTLVGMLAGGTLGAMLYKEE